MKFLVKGQFKKGDFPQTFSKEISAKSEKLAIERIYQILGSNYKSKRGSVKIKEVVKKDD